MAAYRIPRGLDELIEAIEDLNSVGHFVFGECTKKSGVAALQFLFS